MLRGLKKEKNRTPADLSLEEILEGVYVGDYGSWYEHEVMRKVEHRYEHRCTGDPEGGRNFFDEEAQDLHGYDAMATRRIYRDRGIRDAFVLNLPDVGHIGPPACAIYATDAAAPGTAKPHFSIVRFYTYRVLPRFYEDLDPGDLLDNASPGPDGHYGLIDGFPRFDDYDAALRSADLGRGVFHFPVRDGGIGQAQLFAADLKHRMEALGVLCEPKVALQGETDYDPFEEHDDDPHHRPPRDEHSYHDASGVGKPWDAAPPGSKGYHKPRTHRVVAEAGPGVPDQRTADRLCRLLEEYGALEERRQKKEAYLHDPEIPAQRYPELRHDLEQAAEGSRAAKDALLAEPEALLGLMLSEQNALGRLTERVYPLMYYRPEDGRYPPELASLWHLQVALGGLFSEGRSPGRDG